MPASPSKRQAAVGLRDIAEELNVSISLVSKVLSGRLGTSGANSSKIKAIHEKALELGYQKNMLAEALRTGRQNVLALFLHKHGGPGSGIIDEVILGVTEEATRVEQRLSIHYYESAAVFKSFVGRMHRNSVDGVIIAGVAHRDIVDDLKTIHARAIPVVTIHNRELDPSLPNIGMDQREVTRQATIHLIEQGCKSIAHFFVTLYDTSLTTQRFEGYKIALTEKGFPYRPELVIESPRFSYEEGLVAIKKLVDSKVPFDGIVCQSDQQGLAAINYLVTHGVRVPEDVKVTGVDNAPFCDYGVVPLTSVSQEFRNRGHRATQLLIKQLADEEVVSEMIPPTVSVRASSR